MTQNYLDGLPSTGLSSQSQQGRWAAFPEGHPQYGQAFYIADPYWWDGVYPNSIRMSWGPQEDDGLAWTVTFRSSAENTNGVFFRIETRPDWMVSLPVKTPPTNDMQASADGRTRMQCGIISDGFESISVERYFDTLPASNGYLGNAAGLAMFAVFKTLDGYVASISGPRVQCAFSFPCDSVFSSLPVLLTRTWVIRSSNSLPLDSQMRPSSARIDLGRFSLAPDDGPVYDLTAALSLSFSKPHGPERTESRPAHLSLNQAAPVVLSQKTETELVSVGAYGNAGNRIIPYAKAGTTPNTVTATITRTGEPVNYSAEVAPVYVAAMQAIPARSLTTTLAGLQGFGTRFLLPPQQAAAGSAGLPDTDGNVFFTLFDSAVTFAVWSEYPDFSQIVGWQQAYFEQNGASRSPPETGRENYERRVATFQQQLADLEQNVQEWNDPDSTLAPIDFNWNYRIAEFRTAFQDTDQSVSCGGEASAFVDLSLGWSNTNVTTESQPNYENSTAEQVRSGVASNHRKAVATNGNVSVRHLSPHQYTYTRKRWFQPLDLRSVLSTVRIVPTPQGGLLNLATELGQDRFLHKEARPTRGIAVAGVEKSALETQQSQSLPNDIVWELPAMSPGHVATLLSNQSVTYDGTCTSYRDAGVSFSQLVRIAEFPASVTITLT